MKRVVCLCIVFGILLINMVNASFPDKSPYPIQFSIPEAKIVTEIPVKTRDFAYIIPGQLHTYIYNDEFDYYKDYQNSYFAVTRQKGGWDCMRHYEILANGCIPYFLDIDRCPSNTMYFLPKDLIKEAMNLPGVSYLKIDHKKFDKKRYYEILNRLLEHTRKYLTSKNMTKYLLETINYQGSGTILVLSGESTCDYLRDCVLIGLKQLFGSRVVDFPKIDFIYKSYAGDVKKLYGKGFSYTRIVEDIPVDRANIVQRIKDKEFDIVIYGSYHRGLPFLDIVRQAYRPNEIVYICGEDYFCGVKVHRCDQCFLPNFFLREFESKPRG